MSKREDGYGTIWYDEAKKKWRARVKPKGAAKPKTKSFRTKTEASAWVKLIAAAPAPTMYSVQRGYDEWFAIHVAKMCRQTTQDQYAYFYSKHVLPAIGAMAVEDVRAKHVQGVIGDMARKGLSAKTMKGCRIAMHGMFEWLADSGILEKNPCSKIKVPETAVKLRRALAPAEIPKLLEAMAHSRWIHCVRFLMLTGLRRGEVVALKWSDIVGDVMQVQRTHSADGTEGAPKSKAGTRPIQIGVAVQAILDAQEEMLRVERIISPYVFPAESGRPVTPGVLYSTINRFGAKVGVSISVHELRHTFVSYVGIEMDIKTLQLVLGHASSTQTREIYQHLLDGAMKRAAAAVDSVAAGMFAGPPSKVVADISPVISLDAKTGSR